MERNFSSTAVCFRAGLYLRFLRLLSRSLQFVLFCFPRKCANVPAFLILTCGLEPSGVESGYWCTCVSLEVYGAQAPRRTDFPSSSLYSHSNSSHQLRLPGHLGSRMELPAH